MKKDILTSYTLNGSPMIESITWQSIDDSDERGITLPDETGKWIWVVGCNTCRVLPSLPKESIDVIGKDDGGKPIIIQAPGAPIMFLGDGSKNLNYWSSPYWDYYNLPLKKGVVLNGNT